MSEIEAIGVTLSRLTDVLQGMSSVVATHPSREWYPANEQTALLLGYDSYEELWKAIDSGLLRVGKGKEVSDRRKPKSRRPSYYVHLQRALDRLETEPSRRAG